MEAERARLAGTILAVCIGPGGIPKHSVPEARATPAGLVGDKHGLRST